MPKKKRGCGRPLGTALIQPNAWACPPMRRPSEVFVFAVLGYIDCHFFWRLQFSKGITIPTCLFESTQMPTQIVNPNTAKQNNSCLVSASSFKSGPPSNSMVPKIVATTPAVALTGAGLLQEGVRHLCPHVERSGVAFVRREKVDPCNDALPMRHRARVTVAAPTAAPQHSSRGAGVMASAPSPDLAILDGTLGPSAAATAAAVLEALAHTAHKLHQGLRMGGGMVELRGLHSVRPRVVSKS